MRIIDISQRWPDMGLPEQVADLLGNGKSVRFPRSREEVLSMAMGEQSSGLFEVGYDIPGRGRIVEATVAKCKNGLAINYAEPYMRRRDLDCMVVGDAKPTELDPLGARISDCFKDGGSVADYDSLLPGVDVV